MYKYLLLGVVVGALIMGAVVCLWSSLESDVEKQQRLMAMYYASEVATLVSPHNIRERMTHGKDDFVLVDVRAESDYEREHIVGAVNIDTSQSLEGVLEAFKALPTDKEIIIYCYSSACMNGRKAGNFLAENNIFVKELTIGWNEWRYDWEMWNYDTEWDTHKVEDYVVSGSEPGILNPELELLSPCPIDGELSC